MEKVKSRDQARECFKASGLSYSVITRSNLQLLRNQINEKMKASGAIKGTYRCHQRFKISSCSTWADLRCRSYYFDDRQAVTFEKDGFIGFAGWADDGNVQPVIEGFIAWVDLMSKERAA